VTSTASGILGDKRESHAILPASPSGRIVDRLDHRFVNALTALGFGLPVIGYFWFLERYSVNAIVGDQWDVTFVIKDSYVHFFDWGALWAQHNENRIFFPNIVMVVLAHTVHFNVQVEEYLSAVMLAATVIFVIWAHKRRSPSTPWLYYCPIVILAFSVVQYGNTIWGFQMSWYLVLLSLGAAVLLLDQVTLTWVALVGALAAAVVGSFSSLQGLLIWPTGLVLLYFRRRSLPQITAWIVVAVASTIAYFYGYKSPTPDPQFAVEHPLIALKFFLLAIGDVVGKPITNGTWSYEDTLVMLLGLAILLLAVGTLLICGIRPDEHSGSPLGIALICYGVLFALTITQGRIVFGYEAASFSRYTTFDLLILVGIYLALLGRPRHAAYEIQLSTSPAIPQSTSDLSNLRPVNRWWDRVALPCARVVVLVAIVVQIPFGIYNGVQGARHDHARDVAAAVTLRNINHLSNSTVVYNLNFFLSASVLRQDARTLEEHRLSVFANS
jgi:hypothetical protein